MIKLEDVYVNIGHACCASGKWIFDANILKALTLTKTPLTIICVNDNYNDINKYFAIFCRALRYVRKDQNKVKYESHT